MRLALVVVCALMVCGCSQKPAAPQYFTPDASTSGKLHGTVRYDGPKPAPRPISMDAEEACEKLHPTPVDTGTVVLGGNGALANALVYIKSGLEGKTFEPAKDAVVLDQRGCMFVPRVLSMRTGQTLSVKNSDPVSHNVHPRPESNREWNQAQSPGAPDLVRRFAHAEVMIPVRCNIHSWMRSYIAVLDHPYFAVTNEAGTFDWSAVPAGEYTVAVWHESLGELTQQVKLGSRADQTVEFVFHSPAALGKQRPGQHRGRSVLR
jgi:hypothetical protein